MAAYNIPLFTLVYKKNLKLNKHYSTFYMIETISLIFHLSFQPLFFIHSLERGDIGLTRTSLSTECSGEYIGDMLDSDGFSGSLGALFSEFPEELLELLLSLDCLITLFLFRDLLDEPELLLDEESDVEDLLFRRALFAVFKEALDLLSLFNSFSFLATSAIAVVRLDVRFAISSSLFFIAEALVFF